MDKYTINVNAVNSEFDDEKLKNIGCDGFVLITFDNGDPDRLVFHDASTMILAKAISEHEDLQCAAAIAGGIIKAKEIREHHVPGMSDLFRALGMSEKEEE